jgi:hypothetical protein
VPDLVSITAQLTGDVTLHVHPPIVSTWVAVEPPAAETVTSAGLSVKVHGDAACGTANCAPLTAILPLRAVPCGFAAALRVIDASPCPDVGESWIHDVLLDADHEHSRLVTTDTSTRPPAAGIVGTVARDAWHRTGSGAVI